MTARTRCGWVRFRGCYELLYARRLPLKLKLLSVILLEDHHLEHQVEINLATINCCGNSTIFLNSGSFHYCDLSDTTNDWTQRLFPALAT